MISCGVTATPTTIIKIQACHNKNTQTELDRCRDEGLAVAEKQLAEVYSRLKKTYQEYEPGQVPLLDLMVKQWRRADIVECEFTSYFSRGGAAYHAEYIGCLEKKFRLRILQLKKIVETP